MPKRFRERAVAPHDDMFVTFPGFADFPGRTSEVARKLEQNRSGFRAGDGPPAHARRLVLFLAVPAGPKPNS